MERQEAGYRLADECAPVSAPGQFPPHRPSRYHRRVKRALASLAGLVGIAALRRRLAQRRHPAEPFVEPATEPATTAPADDPAEELRRKLADAREAEPEADVGPAEETLDERRARVHAKAREAIDAMGDDGAAS